MTSLTAELPLKKGKKDGNELFDETSTKIMDLEILKAGNTPTEPDKVILSFLGEDYLAGSLIDLGHHLLDKKKDPVKGP